MSYVGTAYTVEQVKAIPNLYERTQDLLVSGSDSPQRRMMVMGQANSLVKSAMADPIQYVSNNFARDIFNDYIGATSNSLKNSVDFLRKSGFTQDQINQKYQEAIPAVQSQLATVEAARQKRESGFGDLMPIIAMGVSLFAPGIGTAIGSALGLTGTAAAVVGSAIVQGTLAEAQGGDFLEGAIKGAVTAGVAPAVANTVGTAVADVMADSAFKNVVANAVASSASSAVTAALTGGDVDQAALTGALAGGVGSVGRDIGTAVGFETDPFSQQTQMLAAQEQGLGTAGGAGANIGQALGAIGAGVDPLQAVLTGASKFAQEVSLATPETATEKAPEAPVSPPPGAEIAAAPPPQTPEIVDTGVMGGVAGTIPEITPPSTQEIPIPDQISQELGGVQEGVAGTIPPLDQELLDLITQPDIPVFQLPEVVITAPREEPIPGIQEGMAEGIPADIESGAATFEPAPVYDPTTVTQLPEIVITGRREEPIPGIQEGMAEGIPEVPETTAPPFIAEEATVLPEIVITGKREEQIPGIQEGMAEGIPDLPAEPAPTEPIIEDTTGLQDGIAGTIPEEDTGVQGGIAGTIPETETVAEPTPYIRDFYISGGRRRGDTFGPTVTTLGQALAPPLFPSSPVSGLTSYRGAGEIEGQQTGKPRRDVWNEASLRLKDALGL